MFDLSKIKDNFSRGALFYNDHATIQSLAAKSMIANLLSTITIESQDILLDLGSGTGFVGKIINKSLGRNVDLALDLSIAQLKINSFCNHKVVADLNNLPLSRNFKNKVVVLSSFALQWLDHNNLKKFFLNLHKLLPVNSIICLNLPISGSFSQFFDANKSSECNFRFVELPEYQSLYQALEGSSWTINHSEIKNFDINYLSATEFLKSIKKIGANYNFLTQNILNKKKLKKINDILIKKYDNVITWRTMELIIKK